MKMELLDLTLTTPAENIALDEALLEEAEQRGEPTEMLRLWESPEPIVVVGRSSRVDCEVRRSACREAGVPILRRSSGGAAIVAGPGCLMYAVILSYDIRPELQMISHAHQFVLGKVAESLSHLVPGARQLGTSDLTVDGKKFSGNSMRCKRTHLLYHGTLLYNFDLPSISCLLGSPPRQPDYRSGRDHAQFVVNLNADATELKAALIQGWQTREALAGWPKQLTQRLVQEKYAHDQWNFRH